MLLKPVPPEPMFSSQALFPKHSKGLLINTADMINGANSKQGTSQKGNCGKLHDQIGTLYTELGFPKIANWFSCFPRFL